MRYKMTFISLPMTRVVTVAITAPDQPFTIEQLGDDVVALLDHLQVKASPFLWYFDGWFDRSMACDSPP